MKRNRGFSLVYFLAFMTFAATTMLISGWYGNSEREMQTAFDKSRGLKRLDDALRAYMTIYGRLPCPSKDQDGEEQCDSDLKKGWIPVKTLVKAGVLSQMEATGLSDYKYTALQGGGDLTVLGVTDQKGDPNLTTLSDDVSWYVQETEGTGDEKVVEKAKNISLHDTCDKLTRPADKNALAYGLAASGLSGFTGKNNSNSFEIEDPQKKQDTTYTEQTRRVQLNNLSEMLQCESVLASMETIVMAARGVQDSKDTLEGKTDMFKGLVDIQGQLVAASTIFGTGAVGSLAVQAAVVANKEALEANKADTEFLESEARAQYDGWLCTFLGPLVGIKFCTASMAEAIGLIGKIAAFARKAPEIALSATEAGLDITTLEKYKLWNGELRDHKVWDERKKLIDTIDKLGGVDMIVVKN